MKQLPSPINLNKSAAFDRKGMGLTALLAALGAGGYYYGNKALEDYEWRSPFRNPIKTKTFSATKLKELSKDPATYLTLLAILAGGVGAYKLGRRRAKKDIMPDPELAELLNTSYLNQL